MTVATYDYAQGAAVWYHHLLAQGVRSGVVIAMDWGGYKYLVSRGIPTVLVRGVSFLFH